MGSTDGQEPWSDADDPLLSLLEDLDPLYRERFLTITECIDRVCDEHLGDFADEYRATCQLMAATCCQEGTPIVEGRAKAESWAAGILWTVGWVNFLDDRSSTPHLTAKQAAAAFGVSVATLEAKSRDLRYGLGVEPHDGRWTLPTLARSNPLIWLLETTSNTVDARTLPTETQQVLVEVGLIPFVVEDYEAEEDTRLRFIQLSRELLSRGVDPDEIRDLRQFLR